MKKQVEEFVGKKALYKMNLSLTIEVKVLDVRKIYGKEQYLIAPIAGSGERWVEDIKIIK